MPRHIDADALLKAMDTWDKFGFSHSGAFVREPENDDYVPYVHYDDMVKCVVGMPTADVVERKHGRWLPYEFGTKRWHKCSACGIADEYINEKGLEARREFCPHCGAQMDGRRDDAVF